MTGLEDQPYRPDTRSDQEISLGCLIFGFVAAIGIFFVVNRMETSPIAWLTDVVRDLEKWEVESGRRDIEINTTLSLSEEKGEFTASGPAVARGMLCAEGTVEDLEYQDISPVPGELTDLLVRKRFLCRQWRGYFLMDLDVDIFESGTTGTWQIVGGVRDYQDLIGSGSFVGVYLEGGNIILDTFTGKIWSTD